MSGTGSVLTAITTVWTAIYEWLISAVQGVMPIFYAEGALTLLGTLVVVGLGISIFFLIVGVISSFFRLRG